MDLASLECGGWTVHKIQGCGGFFVLAALGVFVGGCSKSERMPLRSSPVVAFNWTMLPNGWLDTGNWGTISEGKQVSADRYWDPATGTTHDTLPEYPTDYVGRPLLYSDVNLAALGQGADGYQIDSKEATPDGRLVAVRRHNYDSVKSKTKSRARLLIEVRSGAGGKLQPNCVFPFDNEYCDPPTISADGQFVAASLQEDTGTVSIWSVKDGLLFNKLTGLKAHIDSTYKPPSNNPWSNWESTIAKIKFVGSGATIAAALPDGRVRLYSAITALPIEDLGELGELVEDAAVTPDRKYFCVLGAKTRRMHAFKIPTRYFSNSSAHE